MKRDSKNIWIESLNAITALPWINGSPDFSGFVDPTLSILRSAYEAQKDNIEIIPDPILEPVIPPPDWDGLLNRLLSADLHQLFRAITIAATSNPLIFMARQDIYGAISNPAISDRISALRAGLDMLLASGYVVSPENTALWNTAIAQLNFPDEVKL